MERSRLSRSGVVGALAALSLGCAAIHAVVIPPHFEEFALFGWFFLVVTTFQILWAGLVLARPSRRLLLAGALVNLAIAGIWVWSRTTGLPVGPEPWIPEAVGVRDVVSTAYEVVLAAVAGYALLSRMALERRAGEAVAILLVIVAVLTAIALTSPDPQADRMGAAGPRVAALVAHPPTR